MNDAEEKELLKLFRQTGNLVFKKARQEPSTREYLFDIKLSEKQLQEIRRSNVMGICSQLGLTLAADYQLAEEAYDKFVAEFEPDDTLGRIPLRTLSKLRREFWESKMCEYVCIEKAKIINPDWVPSMLERFKQEQDYLKAQMVAHRLTNPEEPRYFAGIDPVDVSGPSDYVIAWDTPYMHKWASC